MKNSWRVGVEIRGVDGVESGSHAIVSPSSCTYILCESAVGLRFRLEED